YNSSIWGGYGGYGGSSATSYDLFIGNTLNMSAAPLTVKNLGNFQYYNFAINDYNSAVINSSTALITVTKGLLNDNTVSNGTTTNRSQVKLASVSGSATVNTGDTITLISLASGATVTQGSSITTLSDLFDLTNSANTINVGLVRTANVSYSVSDADGTVMA
ncbi:hypothetical protein ACP6ZN_005012, partial [Enterobacter cloacae]